MKIIISKHAIRRLRQRFLFTFPSSCWINERATENLMIGQLTTARKCFKWKDCDFYRNKLTSKYSGKLEVFEKSGVYYCCQVMNDTVFVKTVVRYMYCEN